MTQLPSLNEILQRSQLPALDGFRMIAVISVVLFHANIGGFFFTARHGVAGFFVLSGFLITWLLLKEHQNAGHISLKDFYYRRSLRIFPAYYTFAVLTISWDLFRNNSEIREFILPSIFYYVNYHNAITGHTSSSVSHLWSLAIEEQFYLLWPLLLISMLKLGKKSVINFLIGIIVLVMVWRSMAVSVIGLGQDWAYNSFDTRFDNLAIGCLLAMLIEKRRFQEILQLISSRPWMPVITVVLLSLSRAVTSFHYEYGPAFTIDAFLLAVLLVQLMVLSHGRYYAWLNYRPVVYLGLISYPIYLWHIRGLELGNKMIFLPEPLQLLSGILCGIAMAACSYHMIEKPFLRLKKRFQHYGRPT